MSITAVVENDIIKLPPGIHVPDGTCAEIVLRTEETRTPAPGSFFETIQDLVGSVDGLPEDFAAEHDHYIHGTPKRQSQ